MISKRMKDTIGMLIISSALLFVATSAMSMDTRTMLTMFYRVQVALTDGYIVYINSDRLTINGDVITL